MAGFMDFFKRNSAQKVALEHQGASTNEPASMVQGTIGQNTISGGAISFGDFSAAKFHDAATGNAGQYSTPGGVGHAPLETTQRSFENLFHATPHGTAPVRDTHSGFFPFAMQQYPTGMAVTPPAKAEFRRTVRHQPGRGNLTGQA